MVTNITDIASQIITALRLSDPELDTSVGSVTRKIIDAVSESISASSIDTYLLGYQYDIDSKVDADLDDFVGNFGMARIAARRASGLVTFTRNSAVTDVTTVLIPIHAQVNSTTNPMIVVQSVAAGYMDTGAQVVTLPVQAVVAGPQGNLAAGTLTKLTTFVKGVGSVTNVRPLTGGTGQETDSELRERWKKTVFRNLAGTEQMYLGVARDDLDCYIASVIGSTIRRREQIQVVSGAAPLSVDDARYVYAEPVFVGVNIDGGDMGLRDVDWEWNQTPFPPEVSILNSEMFPDGGLIEVDYQYVPIASRNDPDNGITNRVDIWVGGSRSAGAVQSLSFALAPTFNATPGDPMNRANFVRANDQPPASGNIFVPLAYGPIITVPATLSIAGKLYGLADDTTMGTTVPVTDDEDLIYAYRMVHDDTQFGYTATGRFGLEWHNAVGFVPTEGATYTIGGQTLGTENLPGGESTVTLYLFNDVIRSIQNAIDKWRLLGVDVQVHQAKLRPLRFNFAVMYEPRIARDITNFAIDNALADFLLRTSFQGRVQVSDILQAVHNVAGVDNVRFLRGDDYPGYVAATPDIYDVGIQRILDGDVVQSYVDPVEGRVYDLRFGDDELPLFDSCIKEPRAENSFGGS